MTYLFTKICLINYLLSKLPLNLSNIIVVFTKYVFSNKMILNKN